MAAARRRSVCIWSGHICRHARGDTAGSNLHARGPPPPGRWEGPPVQPAPHGLWWARGHAGARGLLWGSPPLLPGEGVACMEEEGPRDHGRWSRGPQQSIQRGLDAGPPPLSPPGHWQGGTGGALDRKRGTGVSSTPEHWTRRRRPQSAHLGMGVRVPVLLTWAGGRGFDLSAILAPDSQSRQEKSHGGDTAEATRPWGCWMCVCRLRGGGAPLDRKGPGLIVGGVRARRAPPAPITPTRVRAPGPGGTSRGREPWCLWLPSPSRRLTQKRRGPRVAPQ